MLNLLIVSFFTFTTFASPKLSTELYIPGKNPEIIKDLVQTGSVVVDHVSHHGFEVYGNELLAKELERRGVSYLDLTSVKESVLADYPSYQEILANLRKMEVKYSKFMKLFSIGKTVQGRELWVMKISDNVTTDEVEPEFKYISSMHGDEITGREMCMRFIDELGQRYGSDDRVTKLINQTEIFILPSMNPDASELRRRSNANYVDLNRNFPEWTKKEENTTKGREIENQAVMRWQAERNFSLSANFHGGALVANYPWDSTLEPHPFKDLLIELSLAYSELNPEMYASREYSQGITNGAQWYVIRGGMQDWSYFWYNDLQITVEVSDQKWPSYNEIPHFYEINKDSMLRYLEKVHQGVGVKGKFPSGSELLIKEDKPDGKLIGSYSLARGEIYKVLPSGFYQLQIKNKNQILKTLRAEVRDQVGEKPNYLEF